MNILRTIAVLALVLLVPLTACTQLPTPSTAANATVLDEKAAIGVELAYKGARIAMETLVDAGVITGEKAAKVAALDSKAFAATQAVQAAYKAANAASYDAAVLRAHEAITGFLAALRE